jgi:uncharacterized phage-associated protein
MENDSATENHHAKGTARPEAPSRYGCGGDYGREDCDRRNRREIEGTIGQSAVWKGRSESACGETLTGGTFGHRKESGGWALGIMASVFDVCDYIISRLSEAGQSLNVLKLHKLLYYSQAWHLAFERERLFVGHFQAWVHGPVSRAIYDRYAQTKSLYSPLTTKDVSQEFDPKAIRGRSRQIINAVLERYGSLSGDQLEEMTHRETPWLEARGDVPENERSENTISEATMRDFYGSRIKKSKRS